MKQINYKSDFDFIADIKMIGVDGSEVSIGFPTYDWELTLSTGCMCYATRKFVASYKNGVAANCFNDNGLIHVVCDNHNLSVGVLTITFNSEIPNDIYPDGLQKIVATKEMDIELVSEGETTDQTIEVSMSLPIISGDGIDTTNLLTKTEAEETYAKIADIPTIPSEVSAFTNDAGYITADDIPSISVPDNIVTTEDLENYQPKGDYALKSDIPSVPTKTSELTNDSNFINKVSIVSTIDTDTGSPTPNTITLLNDESGVNFGWVSNENTGDRLAISANLSSTWANKINNKANAEDISHLIVYDESNEKSSPIYGDVEFASSGTNGYVAFSRDSAGNPNFVRGRVIGLGSAAFTSSSDYATASDLNDKQDKLTSGNGIDITNNVISCTLDTTLYVVVSELPDVGVENKIYLIESNPQGEQNIYAEYAYVNDTWEMLGQYRAEINLAPYALKTDIPTKTSQLTNDSNFATLDDIPATETYVLNFTIKDGVNTGTYTEEEYAPLRAAIEAGKLIIIGGTVTRVTADSQAMAADYVVIRYSTPRIGDDNTTITISFYELKFSATEYTSKAIHKTIG